MPPSKIALTVRSECDINNAIQQQQPCPLYLHLRIEAHLPQNAFPSRSWNRCLNGDRAAEFFCAGRNIQRVNALHRGAVFPGAAD